MPVFVLNAWVIKVDRGQSMSNTLATKRRGLDLNPLLVHPLLFGFAFLWGSICENHLCTNSTLYDS